MRKRSDETLIIIDMLEDFCAEGGPLYVPATREAIPNIAREVARARKERATVIYVCDAHAVDDPEFAYWPAHAIKGTEGARVVEELTPLPGDIVIEKTTLSSFMKTRLDAALKKAKARRVTITGCVTEICVLFTVFDAMARGYKVKVIKDCVAGLDPKMGDCALAEMETALKAEVV